MRAVVAMVIGISYVSQSTGDSVEDPLIFGRLDMGKSSNKVLGAVVAAGALALGSGIASATTVVDFDLGALNAQGYTGPYVHVNVTEATGVTTQATVTFTSLTNGGDIYL